MNIAVNTRLLLKDRLEGIGWFSYETLKRIARNHPEHNFIFIFDRPYHQDFVFSENVTPAVTGPPARHAILWYLWFEWSIPRILKKYKADIFFSPDGWLSLSTDVPSVSVIHDLNFHHFPQFLPRYLRWYYHYFFPRFARKARRIATVSEFSKQDISTRYGIDPTKIDVVYNGGNETYVPLNAAERKKTMDTYAGGNEYFMFVGLIHPRKNLSNLFKGFDEFKKRSGSSAKLVIVGEKKWWTPEIENSFSGMEFKNHVVFTGRMPVKELHEITASALAMVYVPYFEGFGIPILEAMKCGTPVITSNVTSMPEVGADAVLLADPNSPQSIAGQMLKLNSDPYLRKSLIERGFERSKDFSWDITADKLWKTIEKAF